MSCGRRGQDAGRIQVARELQRIPKLQGRAAALERATLGWRCKTLLCKHCMELEGRQLRDRWYHVVVAAIEQIDREQPPRPRALRHIVLTTQQPPSHELVDATYARLRVQIATRAFTRFQKRIDWFQSRQDSFALSGWHAGAGWPHLHLLVYGDATIRVKEIEQAWWESYAEAFQEIKAEWEAQQDAGGIVSRHAEFMQYRPALRVQDEQGWDEWDKRDLAHLLKYLVEEGWSDEKMQAKPRLAATIIASWYGRPRSLPYGLLRQHPLRFSPPQSPSQPRANVDYPSLWRDFKRFFPERDEPGYWPRHYLERLRWPEGFQCPGCGARADPWRRSGGTLRCSVCRSETSVTAGTLFQRTRIPLRTWLRVAWHLVGRQGTSARELATRLGLRYESVWRMLQRLRKAMAPRGVLRKRVHVDVTTLSCADREVRVAVIAQVGRRARGAVVRDVRLLPISDGSRARLHGAIQSVVEPGAAVHTNGALAYLGLEELGYTHVRTRVSRPRAKPTNAQAALQEMIERLGSWFQDAYRGAVQAEHLGAYLQEFAFRLRHGPKRGRTFYHLVRAAVQGLAGTHGPPAG